MTTVVFVAIYSASLVFLVACVARAKRYASLPAHLRWELYPVPHEPADRLEHGGSYLEQREWWTRPRRRHYAGQWRFMIAEMVFLKGLWEWNRPLWFRSFPFHFGLYLLAASGFVLLTAAGVTLAVPAADAPFRSTVAWLYRGLGAAGGALALAGALGLLHRRVTDRTLRIYSAPADVFNLAFFAVTIIVLALGYGTAGARFPGPLTFTRGLLRFETSLAMPPLLALGVVLACALVAYIPLTHMAHFIGKYFTYHAVRWDDAPMDARGRLARRIAASLATRPTWSAPHVGADGTRTWAAIASSNPAPGGTKE
ncbi:MAG: respiratory nitrate reductase subunit gamma [Bacteroidales bacterium]